MSVITNFKKRTAIKAQQQKDSVESKITQQSLSQDAEPTALMLLAKLLNVAEEIAIDEATKYVESNIQYFVGVDHASGKDKTVTAIVDTDGKGNVTTITETTDTNTDVDEFEAVKGELVADIENSADAVQSAASNVESSADSVEASAQSVENSASDLAYTADDINNATNELKEVASEIKKPSAAPKSSSSKKNNEPKNS